jgi:hypothetical protein
MLLAIPYVLGYLSARPGTFYTGTLMNPEDSQSYFAKMLQGYDGGWLYTIPFTSEPHQPAFLGTFYLSLGHLARVTGLSLTAAWHLGQLAAAMLLFLTIYWFVSCFLVEPAERRVAYLLAVFGSGLGWLLFAVGQIDWLGAFPVDFKMPEAHPFFNAMTFPHAALGTALLLAILALLLPAGPETPLSWRTGLVAGLLNVALGIVYPFLMYLVVAVVFLYWLLAGVRARREGRRMPWRLAAVYGLSFALAAPLYVYYAYVRQANEVFRAWDAQAVTGSPPWPHYLVAFGPLLVLGMSPLLARRSPAQQAPGAAYLWLWVIGAAVLLYLPFNPQRRFVQGVHVPLSVLATTGLLRAVLPRLEVSRVYRRLLERPRYSPEGLRNLVLFSVMGLMALSNVYLLADLSLTMAVKQPYPFFRSESEAEAIDWLRANSARSEVVLAAYETGNYVAAQAGNRVVVGHWAETVDWQGKLVKTNRFFSGAVNEPWLHAFLVEEDVSYVWLGAQERKLGSFDPKALANVRPVYYNDEVTLFAVR